MFISNGIDMNGEFVELMSKNTLQYISTSWYRYSMFVDISPLIDVIYHDCLLVSLTSGFWFCNGEIVYFGLLLNTYTCKVYL